MVIKIDQLRRMGPSELIEVQKDVENVIREKREAATEEFKQQIYEQARALGLDIHSLFDSKRRGPKVGKAGIKYRDPRNPENVWSGRGRPAKWLAAYLEKGKKKEDFLVQ
jgi:DNA-binding protein H-NS